MDVLPGTSPTSISIQPVSRWTCHLHDICLFWEVSSSMLSLIFSPPLSLSFSFFLSFIFSSLLYNICYSKSSICFLFFFEVVLPTYDSAFFHINCRENLSNCIQFNSKYLGFFFFFGMKLSNLGDSWYLLIVPSMKFILSLKHFQESCHFLFPASVLLVEGDS